LDFALASRRIGDGFDSATRRNAPASSVFPGTGIKVAITFTFPRRISAGTGR